MKKGLQGEQKVHSGIWKSGFISHFFHNQLNDPEQIISSLSFPVCKIVKFDTNASFNPGAVQLTRNFLLLCSLTLQTPPKSRVGQVCYTCFTASKAQSQSDLPEVSRQVGGIGKYPGLLVTEFCLFLLHYSIPKMMEFNFKVIFQFKLLQFKKFSGVNTLQ